MAGLDRTRHTVIYVPNPAIGPRGLHVSIVAALGGKPRFHKAEVIAQTAELLAAEQAERHRRVVLVIDDAHLPQADQLEQLRLLTNAEMDSASPFGLLVGQPTLSRQLRIGVFAALDQRIATRYTLPPMDLGESSNYLRHHLSLAGRSDPISPTTPPHGCTATPTGYPALNNAASQALIAAAAAGKALIDETCAKQAVAELTRE